MSAREDFEREVVLGSRAQKLLDALVAEAKAEERKNLAVRFEEMANRWRTWGNTEAACAGEVLAWSLLPDGGAAKREAERKSIRSEGGRLFQELLEREESTDA